MVQCDACTVGGAVWDGHQKMCVHAYGNDGTMWLCAAVVHMACVQP
jgi:hypothetical protein